MTYGSSSYGSSSYGGSNGEVLLVGTVILGLDKNVNIGIGDRDSNINIGLDKNTDIAQGVED